MAVSQSNNIQNNNENSPTKPLYGKVILTLENCILPQEKLLNTPSQVDGLDRESELDLRYLGCEIIQTSGILLRLPQVAMATGQIIFQRFYYCKSFVRHPMEIVAMACITLASKIEESPRRIRDVINVLHHIKQVRAGKTIQPLILDHNYIAQKNHVIKAERRILKELGFCVHVKHPHKIIVTLLEILKAQNRKSLLQTSWNYMNDSLRSDVFLRYPPEHIACACIYLSARLLSIPLPSKPAWFLVFGVNEATIKEICNIILSLYARKKPDAEHLEKLVDDLRKTHQEAKQKAKNLSGNASPIPMMSNFSPKTNNSIKAVSPKHLDTSGKKDSTKMENNSSSPTTRSSNHDYNHYHNMRKRSHSSSPSPKRKRRNPSESSRSSSSSSHGGRTPPRSYKEHRPRHRHSHKHKKSRSPSSSNRHHRKHSYKSSNYYKNSDKKNNYYYNEKPRKSKKERSKDSSRHHKNSPHRHR